MSQELSSYWLFPKYKREPILPTARKTLRILHALQSGEHLTVASALTNHGVYALSQECGRLRNLHWPVQDKRIEVSEGVWVKEFWL